MSKISFFKPFGKKASSTQDSNIIDAVVPELQDPPKTTSQTSVTTFPAAPINTPNATHSPRKYICEVCPKDTTKSYGSPMNLVNHIKDNHPSEYQFQLTIPISKNYGKKWKVGQVKTVIETYLQLRATQNVGRRFIIRRTTGKNKEMFFDAYWVNCSEQPDTSNFSHVKAMNAAAMAVGRNTKSVRDVLNGTSPQVHGVVKHQPVLVRQLGGIGSQCELTPYGLKRIKQIRDKCGYVGSGGIKGLELPLTPTTTVQKPKQSDTVVGDPSVMQPRKTQETEVNDLVWKDEPSNIVSTWAGLTEGVLKYIAKLEQQNSDLKNQDQNRIDKEDTFIKEMEDKDQTISEKNAIIESQKKYLEKQMSQNNSIEISKEQDELKIQVQNLTEERDILFTANEKLVQQAKAHNLEKQSSTLAKKIEVQAMKNRMDTMKKDLESIEKDL